MESALVALRAGDGTRAQLLLHERLLTDPEDAIALALLAGIALDEKRIDEATLLMRRSVAADPSPQRHLALVRLLHKHASPAIALKEIEVLPADVRSGFDVRSIEAAALGMLGDHERQISLYQGMVDERPGQAGLWTSLANALKTVGRTDEAVAALKRAIKAQPSHGEAYWTLADFKSYQFTPRDLNAMRQALRKKLEPRDALNFHFALGKAYEDVGAFEQSFRHYAEGNRIRSESVSPEQGSVTCFVDQAIATFIAEFFERNRGSGCPDFAPIFVVGLHRSGSTLIEQILASHPLVEGTTELGVMNHIRDRLVRAAKEGGTDSCEVINQLDRSEFAKVGAEYIERTRPFRRTDRPYFVDKLPANWMNLALISLALPNATIIDARRHPMACGFSNFKQNYAKGIAYAYTLESIGSFYQDYWRFMAHFDRVQPGVVHRVINERLIEDPEREIRLLLAHVGLPFDPACLEFHHNRRAVRTPSAEQVRRPINRDGVDTWRHYESWLGPLSQALGPAIEGWDQ